MMSPGQWNNETAKLFYKLARETINRAVKSGQINPQNADYEWAKMVSNMLKKSGFKVSKKILEMLKR